MRLRHFILAMTGAAGLAIMPAVAQQTVVTSAPRMPVQAPITMNHPDMNGMAMRRSWGHRVDGRWWGGYQAPGGWAGYRRPVTGFVLPGYWLQPSYYISDYRYYGLPAPTAGYGWSRYYDDAVMTDRYGRVYDSRIGYDWDRYDSYDDAPGYREDGRRGDDGRVLGGAVIGGVAGGLLGSAVAGPGNRTGGAILGAGLGAIAGGAIASAGADGRRDQRYGGAPGYSYERWASLDDATRLKSEARQRKAWEKERRRLDKLAREAGYANYDEYVRIRDRRTRAYGPTAGQPHWTVRGGPEGKHPAGGHADNMPRIETQTLPGYVANGYYYPGETITTVTVAPSTVTTTTTSYVTTSRKVVRPKSKLLKRKVVRSCRCG